MRYVAKHAAGAAVCPHLHEIPSDHSVLFVFAALWLLMASLMIAGFLQKKGGGTSLLGSKSWAQRYIRIEVRGLAALL